MAVFDATALIHLLEPDARAVVDPRTNQPVSYASARINYLVQMFGQSREKVVIPTPALSEVLVHADQAAEEYLSVFHNSASFRVVPFDERAAIELAAITRAASGSGDLRAGADITRATLKFDRQIIAIARIEREKTIYSDDAGMRRIGAALGVTVIPTYDLPSPPAQQARLPFETPATDDDARGA